MSTGAVFTGPNGADPRATVRAEIQALSSVTVGDLLFVGQVYRSRIRTRTLKGIDASGAPFTPYSTKGPYYFYPNKDSASLKSVEGQKARATAAKNRHAKTGKQGTRTPFGIRYDSYAAAKAAHGVANVNLYGMEQHTHMLDTMLVKAGGSEMDASLEGFDFGSDMTAFEQNQACQALTLGFYGPEAERAKGQNEGNSKTPKREFFALNPQDLELGEKAIAERMMIRARAGTGASPAQQVGSRVSGPITDEDVGF